MTRIAVVGNISDGRFGCNADYMEWVYQFGTPSVFSGHLDDFSHGRFDALLLPGGADVAVSRYSKLPSFFLGKSDPYFEFFDVEVLPKLIGKLPIFGICRGLQTLNVVMGGTLIQHLFFHPYSQHETDLVHEVSGKIADKEITFKVNSFHHQAIGVLGTDVRAPLRAKDGTIEAIISERNKFAGVQYHPERCLDDYSPMLFGKIL